MAIRKIELKKGVSSREIQALWDSIIDMRRRPQWCFFEQLLPKLLYGTPEARKWTIEKVFEDLCNLNCGIQEHLNSLDHGRSDREVLIEVNESIGKLLDGPGTLWGFDSRPVRFDDGGR